MFSSKNFTVSGLTFRSLIHFEFVFVYGVRKCSNFILLHVAERLIFMLREEEPQNRSEHQREMESGGEPLRKERGKFDADQTNDCLMLVSPGLLAEGCKLYTLIA